MTSTQTLSHKNLRLDKNHGQTMKMITSPGSEYMENKKNTAGQAGSDCGDVGFGLVCEAVTSEKRARKSESSGIPLL